MNKQNSEWKGKKERKMLRGDERTFEEENGRKKKFKRRVKRVVCTRPFGSTRINISCFYIELNF
jgi:hypothetical protein